MSDSSASISALPGSCFSSWVTYSCDLQLLLAQLGQVHGLRQLAAVVGLQGRLAVALGLELVGGVGQHDEPAAADDHGQRRRRTSRELGQQRPLAGLAWRSGRGTARPPARATRRRRHWGLGLGCHRSSSRTCRPPAALAGVTQRWPRLPACGRLASRASRSRTARRCRAASARRGLDLDQLGLLQPLGVVERVAQELRHPLVGLRDAGDRHDLAVLLDDGEVDAFGRLLDQLVEQVDRDVAVGLQVLDRLLARLQRLDLGAQVGDVLDLRLELA